MTLSSRAHHDFANAMCRIRLPIQILRSKPFVRVFVACENQVRVRGVEVLPERP